MLDKGKFPYGVAFFGSPSWDSCSKCHDKTVLLADFQWDVDEITTLCKDCAVKHGFMDNLREGEIPVFQKYQPYVCDGCGKRHGTKGFCEVCQPRSDTSLMGKTVACTGHRPNKLGGYDDFTFSQLVKLAQHALTRLQPKAVIVGGALGWDQACARACINLKIPFTVYKPFEGYDANWPWDSRRRADWIHSHAYSQEFCSPPMYAAWKMMYRNQRMVDDAEIVLALYDGSGGGTKNCVDYAKKKSRKVLNLWDRWCRKDF